MIAKVFSLTQEGEGKVAFEDREISIPFALPGETLRLSSVKKGRKTNYILDEIISCSSQRAAPFCSHFTACGGCSLQHMSVDLYREFKKSLVTQALIDHHLDPFLCLDPIWLPFKERRRANCDGIKKGSEMILGFHRWKRHSIIDVQECQMLHPDLFSILTPLREVFAQILLPFQKVKVFLLNSDAGLDVGIEIQGCDTLSSDQRTALTYVFEHQPVARAFFRHRKHKDILCQNNEPYMQFDGVPVSIDAYSFVQASKTMDQLLARFVEAWLSEDRPKRVIDLFCGHGTLSLPLSRFAEVDAFELDALAVERLKRASTDRSLKVYQQDLFQSPVSDFSGVDGVVLNPPRAGAEAQARILAMSNVSRIAYLSCNPKTMARDVEILTTGGYVLESVQPIDQFPGSFHMECLSFLSKK